MLALLYPAYPFVLYQKSAIVIRMHQMAQRSHALPPSSMAAAPE